MTPEIFKQNADTIVESLRPLGESALVVVANGAELAVRQNYVYAYSDFAVGTLLLVLIIAVIMVTIHEWRGLSDDERRDRDVVHGIYVVSFLVLLLMVPCLIMFYMGIVRCVNPEYYAIRDVLNVLKK